ncbi:hypothetical protein BLS_000421 [Venturia inaequalis]|uniref:Uncharacterized protein n=1 Tax=Venturia inaequalis TaxID=5025 RepID=A0A8H3U3H2_VENIN|nr:hypothetical protein EG328_001050 [Venturia inaequalis]KAE9962370.1 hypothetical protein BLS_000421 [Venturia inaequalis]KAE9968030.1 hypothetical protein EG327_011232 [Venturia inaequalis]RDI79738.1 hypothetical protein Vi05172_g10255 [Venturia inaequalis]
MSSSFAHGAQTLPRNFTFTYHDGALPKTPEPIGGQDRTRHSPPPPREYRDNFRLRRRRPPISAAQRSFRAIYPPSELADPFKESSDIVIPSIEVSDAPTGFNHVETSFNDPTSQLAVLSPEIQPYSPPKTPAAQIYGSVYPLERDDPAEDSSSQGESLTRPSTACSGFSDSSISSSVESFPSLGYNNSPKGDMLSLFGEAAEHDVDPMVSSPLQSYGQPVVQKQTWTQSMDDHLWITYMRYLQDPTHTPFKMLPGTAPPLGVCSRVVREAKRTWKGLRATSVPPAFRFARWGSNRAAALNEDVEESATPVAIDNRRTFATWPRSDAASRKRLRDLCKRKPTLSAHYNRLMHARSPSPFLSSVRERSTSLVREAYSPPPAPVQAHVQGTAFSTRDMNVSLFTSISTTMQPGHPLSQLTSDAATPRARASTQFLPAYGRSPGHQKAQSVHLGFGINDSTRHACSHALASPFRPTHSSHFNAAEAHGPLHAIVSGSRSGLSLGSPVELHQPQPRRTIFKRPATQELEDVEHSEDPLTRQNHLMKELFGPSQPMNIGHRRVRSRGFSLGDMSGTSRLSGMFSPPTDFDQPESSARQAHEMPDFLMAPPSIDRVVRLGSPFVEKPYFNTFPRNFSLSSLEPAMEIHEDQVEIARSPSPQL